MGAMSGTCFGGNVPQSLLDALVEYMQENGGKARFYALKQAVVDTVSSKESPEDLRPLEVLLYTLSPQTVIFSAYSRGIITAKLKDPRDLSSIKDRTKFKLVTNKHLKRPF